MARPNTKGREAASRSKAGTLLGCSAEPHEAAPVAAFRASQEASDLTGETIYRDGGRLALNDTEPVKE